MAIPAYRCLLARGLPVVGATADCFKFRGLRLAQGRPLVQFGKVVSGAGAAARLDLVQYKTLVTDAQTLFDLAGVYPPELTVAGVPAPAGTADDAAVFVDPKTAWIIAGIGHGHDEVAKGQGNVVASLAIRQLARITPENTDSFHLHQGPALLPLSAVLVTPNDYRSAAILQGRYLEGDNPLHLIAPKVVINGLLQTLFRIGRLLDGVVPAGAWRRASRLPLRWRWPRSCARQRCRRCSASARSGGALRGRFRRRFHVPCAGGCRRCSSCHPGCVVLTPDRCPACHHLPLTERPPTRVLLVAAMLVPGISRAEPLSVVASNDVPAYFAVRLGGEAVSVTMPVPEGTDPATLRPSIAAIAAVQDAGLMMLDGAGYEDWATRVSLPRARTVDTARGMDADLIQFAGTSHSHSHGNAPAQLHDGIAPLVWLDFALAVRQAETLATAMTRTAPDTPVADSLTGLRTDVAAPETEAAALGKRRDGLTVVVLQPGCEYFGAGCGMALREVTLDAFAPPAPDQLAALDAAIAETGATLMLWDTSPPAVTAAARAERGIAAVIFTSAANPPAGADVLESLQANLAHLRAALNPG